MRLPLPLLATLASLALAGCGGGNAGGEGLVTVSSGASFQGARAATDFEWSQVLQAGPLKSFPAASCFGPLNGACQLFTCVGTPQPVSLPDGTPTTTPSAGTVTMTVAAQSLDLSSGAATATAPLWASPGGPVAVHATGADVPAFDLQVAAPSTAIVLTSPHFLAGGPVIVRSKDAGFQWTGGAAGGVVKVYLFDGGATAITCSFDAAPGQGTIPAALLGSLEAGGSGEIALSSEASAETTAGNWTVTLRAQAEPPTLAGSGNRAQGFVELD